MAVPLLVVGIGFKLAVTSITVVAVNSVPTPKAGMASGATSMFRDFGLTLGPAIIGAVALSRAANEITAKVSASPSLQAGAQGVQRRAGAGPGGAAPGARGGRRRGQLGAARAPTGCPAR